MLCSKICVLKAMVVEESVLVYFGLINILHTIHPTSSSYVSLLKVLTQYFIHLSTLSDYQSFIEQLSFTLPLLRLIHSSIFFFPIFPQSTPNHTHLYPLLSIYHHKP